VLDATADVPFGRADLTVFCGLDDLGLEVVGQRLEPGRAVLACRVPRPASAPASQRAPRWTSSLVCSRVA
jgi:hypothetical protein